MIWTRGNALGGAENTNEVRIPYVHRYILLTIPQVLLEGSKAMSPARRQSKFEQRILYLVTSRTWIPQLRRSCQWGLEAAKFMRNASKDLTEFLQEPAHPSTENNSALQVQLPPRSHLSKQQSLTNVRFSLGLAMVVGEGSWFVWCRKDLSEFLQEPAPLAHLSIDKMSALQIKPPP